MARTYEGNGQDWRVLVGESESRPGLTPVVFHCSSNSSWGWRVAETPTETLVGRSADDLSDSELDELFAEASPFGSPQEPKAQEGAIGHTPVR